MHVYEGYLLGFVIWQPQICNLIFENIVAKFDSVYREYEFNRGYKSFQDEFCEDRPKSVFSENYSCCAKTDIATYREIETTIGIKHIFDCKQIVDLPNAAESVRSRSTSKKMVAFFWKS